MWFTLLVMAFAVSLEPFRLGMAVLMLNRPRPTLQLTALLGGGLAMGIGVGLVILFGLGDTPLDFMQLSLPKVQLLIGGLALVAAAVLALQSAMKRPPTVGDSDRERPVSWLRRQLNRSSRWVAVLAGLAMALPSVDYLAALAVIMASATTAVSRCAWLLLFNVLAFAPVELPLVGYLLAPCGTRAAMTAVNRWVRSRRRVEVATVLAAVGCVILGVGLADL